MAMNGMLVTNKKHIATKNKYICICSECGKVLKVREGMAVLENEGWINFCNEDYHNKYYKRKDGNNDK